jgi:UDP-N-acetylglucosamine 2-epimerase
MKIVYFDYWTSGIHNFVPLSNSLCSEEYETMLFHIGSYNDPGFAKEEYINGILCRDISYYNTKYIYNALKKIKPDVIVSLNTTYLLDRALVIACRHLNIKTVFMMHGDRPIGDEIDAVIKSRPYTLYKKIKKIKKYLSIVMPNFILSSWYYNWIDIVKFKPLKTAFGVFRDPEASNYYPPYPEDIIHDKCLVFANKYIEYYKNLGYDNDQIFVVGNPRNDQIFQLLLEKFPVHKMNSEKNRELITSNKKYALYLEDSFQEQGMGGWTYNYLVEHLNEIAKNLLDRNLQLVVKIHPTTKVEQLQFINPNIIITDTDLEHLIYYSEFCIGHISSTINLAILLKKPVLVPRWSKSKNIPNIFGKYNVANSWESINDCINVSINKSAFESYIKDNITITEPISTKRMAEEVVT